MLTLILLLIITQIFGNTIAKQSESELIDHTSILNINPLYKK